MFWKLKNQKKIIIQLLKKFNQNKKKLLKKSKIISKKWKNLLFNKKYNIFQQVINNKTLMHNKI